MKIHRIAFITIFLILLFSSVFPQNVDSSVSINAAKEKVIISGVVFDETTKSYLVRTIKAKFGNAVDNSKLKIDSSVKPFGENWKKEFDLLLATTKNRSFGLFIFKRGLSEQFPPIAELLMQTDILLNADNENITKLNDYKDKIIVLSFVEYWASPAQSFVLELNKIYDENSGKNIELIAVSSETSDDEKAEFRKFVTQNKIQFKAGWADERFYELFSKISNFSGIPQTFIIKDGKLRAVFVGNSPKVKAQLREVITDLAK